MSAACDCYWVRAQAHQSLDLCGGCMHRRGAKCLCPNRRARAEQVIVKAANAVYDSAVLLHETEENVHISMSAAAWEALTVAVNGLAALANLKAGDTA